MCVKRKVKRSIGKNQRHQPVQIILFGDSKKAKKKKKKKKERNQPIKMSVSSHSKYSIKS